MMILCKTVHTLLGFPDPYHLQKNPTPTPTRYFPPSDSVGGLQYLAGAPPKDSHVVAHPAVGRPAPPRPDPGSWGLHEAEEGGGFAICTENLGSESCDAADSDVAVVARSPRRVRRSARRRRTERRRDFPPPLPWLAEGNGRRSRFMKGERKDGRFLLTEVTIERPEILRASRQDGRLRLHLIESSSSSSSSSDEEVELVVVEEEERREMVGPRAVRCTHGAVSGNGRMEMWWGHRFVTTA